MAGRIAVVQDEGVFDAELFEEPENALGLGVLVVELVRTSRGGGEEVGDWSLHSCGGVWAYCLPL